MCCLSPDVSLKTKKAFNLNNDRQYKLIFFHNFLLWEVYSRILYIDQVKLKWVGIGGIIFFGFLFLRQI